MNCIFPYIGNVIIPTDEVHHFSEGLAATTNQISCHRVRRVSKPWRRKMLNFRKRSTATAHGGSVPRLFRLHGHWNGEDDFRNGFFPWHFQSHFQILEEKILAEQKEKEELKALLPTSELPEASSKPLRAAVEPVEPVESWNHKVSGYNSPYLQGVILYIWRFPKS